MPFLFGYNCSSFPFVFSTWMSRWEGCLWANSEQLLWRVQGKVGLLSFPTIWDERCLAAFIIYSFLPADRQPCKELQEEPHHPPNYSWLLGMDLVSVETTKTLWEALIRIKMAKMPWNALGWLFRMFKFLLYLNDLDCLELINVN